MQLEFEKVKGWGGRRKGAGRPNRSGLRGHTARAKISHKTPLHLTFKVRKGVVDLRTRGFLKEFQKAITRAQKFGLNVVHYSIQRDHVHIIAEAQNNRSLTKGTKSLGRRLGHRLRQWSSGVGPVFRERFHMHVLKTPTEVKNALLYVLLNSSKHRKLIGYLDEFASGRFFTGWGKLLKKRDEPLLFYELSLLKVRGAEFLGAPGSWLLKMGWART